MIRRTILLAGLLTISTLSAHAEGAPLFDSSGQVTLTWPKFNELWTQLDDQKRRLHDLEHPTVVPPVPFALSRAAYQGVVGKSRVAMQARFEISVFEPKEWVKVPFFPAGVALQDAVLDGEPVGVIQDENASCVVLKGAGRHTLAVRFSVKAPDPDQAPQVHFDLIPTPMTALSLTLSQKNLDIHVEPSQGTMLEPTNGGTLLTAWIPPTGSVNVRWQKAVAEENEGPSKLYLDAATLLTVSESAVHAHAVLNYSVLHQGVRQFSFLVPSGWNVFGVQGDGVQDWKRLEARSGTTLLVTESYARKGAVQLIIDLERALNDGENAFEIPRLQPINVERESGTLGVEVKGSVEMQIAGHKELSPMDPQELPPVIWQSAGQPILNAFRYSAPYGLSLTIRRPPQASVLTTTIDQADAVTLMTDHGQIVTKVTYHVRNHLKPSLTLQLPKGAQLWSAFVAGEAVKPTTLDGNAFRIPLAKSQIEDGGMSGFAVEVVYYQATASWFLLGHRTATFPVPDAPISRASWAISIPERYRAFHIGGDMDEGMAVDSRREAVLNAGLARKTRAFAFQPGSRKELRNELKDSPQEKMGDQEFLHSAPAPISALGADAAAPLTEGVFPVAFDVPTTGRWFYFNQVMVVGTSPTVNVWVIRGHLSTFVLLGLLALGIGIIRRVRA